MARVPVEFVIDEQVARFGQFANESPSQVELERSFFLDDADGVSSYLVGCWCCRAIRSIRCMASRVAVTCRPVVLGECDEDVWLPLLREHAVQAAQVSVGASRRLVPGLCPSLPLNLPDDRGESRVVGRR